MIQIIFQLFLKFILWPFKILFSKKGFGGFALFMAYWLISGMVALVVWAAFGFEAYLTFSLWWFRITLLGLGLIVITTIIKKTIDGYRWFNAQRARSGREKYRTGLLYWIRSRLPWHSSDVPVDGVLARDPAGDLLPTFDPSTSTIVLGETGTGKSTFVKSRVQNWDFDGAVIAHALSEPGGRNEFLEFFEGEGQTVGVISSRDSDLRWDPMLDYRESVQDMETLSEAIFEVRDVKKTGWSEPARTLLTAALVLCSARYGDLARLPKVLGEGPEWIAEEIQEVPGADLVAGPVRVMDESERSTVYTTLLNQLRPLLHSDLFDEDLPRMSLRDYMADPGDRILVMDNIREDRFARGFWRFLVQSAIDFGMSTDGRQQLLLDEFDKLPRIDNLTELASAGRSAGLSGMLVCQDRHQIADVYGDMHRSIWTNCPNRVAFRAGDDETSDLVLSSIGTVELESLSVSDDTEMGHDDERASRGIDTGRPLVSGDLTQMGVGGALVQSPAGWWLATLSEPDLGDDEPSILTRVRSSIPIGRLMGSPSAEGDDASV